MDSSYKKYDIIIGGGGASGLSLAYRLADPKFSHLKVLLIEQESTKENDRTWCSWIKEESIFDDCAETFFENLIVKDEETSHTSNIHPYRYRMIKSSAFYSKVHKTLDACGHIEAICDRIIDSTENSENVIVNTSNGGYEAKWYFKTFAKTDIKSQTRLYVDQHFGGWFVRMNKPVFEPKTALFMDFSIPQGNEVSFMYVLPTSEYEALIELAVFSNESWLSSDYDEVVKAYIAKHFAGHEYEIVDKEYGVIPMTDFDFSSLNGQRIIHIGAAGGAIKSSTGFAFLRIQKQCDYIIECILHGNKIDMSSVFGKRHKLYDKTMLDVILNGQVSGKEVFMTLFQKNDIKAILKFLDEETTLAEELRIMSSCDLSQFGKAFLRQVLQRK